MTAIPAHILTAIKSGPVPVLRDVAGLSAAELTRGERIINFIERYCVVPEGDLVGKPVVLDEFQRAFIISIYDNQHGTDTAILSIARKNAKTATIAFLVLAHLVGPEAIQNSRIISGAMSRDQAAEVYNIASKCVMLSHRLSGIIRTVPSSKTLIGLPMNVEYRAISADAHTAHGKSPVVAILDEVGQIRGPQSDFVDAITTAQAAYADPLLIYISTQAANDADFFSVQIDDAILHRPKRTVCHVYAAAKDADCLDEEAWKAANPALGKFRSLKDMRKQAKKASRMPSFESTFRNLNLNQRVSTVSPFVSLSVWKSCGSDPLPITRLTNLRGGLDLSSRADLTSLVVVGDGPDGKTHVHPFFWTPEIGLVDRAKRDRSPYDVWVRQGLIRTSPGATVDYDWVVSDIGDILANVDIDSIAFDRWRIDVLKKAVERAGAMLPLVEFGQGFKDMSPALESLEALLLNARICHGNNPVLAMCAANAVAVKDPSGNRKLDKQKATGRIDGLVSLAMALGGAEAEELVDLTPFLMEPIIV